MTRLLVVLATRVLAAACGQTATPPTSPYAGGYPSQPSQTLRSARLLTRSRVLATVGL